MNSVFALVTLVLFAGLGLAGCSTSGQAPFGARPAVLAELQHDNHAEAEISVLKHAVQCASEERDAFQLKIAQLTKGWNYFAFSTL